MRVRRPGRIPLTIILKSGDRIRVTVSDWKVTQSNIDGSLTAYNFTDLRPFVPYVCIHEIAAIVRR